MPTMTFAFGKITKTKKSTIKTTRSATNMRWIEEKMKLLGCDKNPNYNLSFYLDSRAMISIQTEKYGIVDVKPLGVIWGKYPQYDKKTTIMFDDLRRNFLMNPQQGLKIRAFRCTKMGDITLELKCHL